MSFLTSSDQEERACVGGGGSLVCITYSFKHIFTCNDLLICVIIWYTSFVIYHELHVGRNTVYFVSILESGTEGRPAT